jgi:Rieske Fe-S protein
MATLDRRHALGLAAAVAATPVLAACGSDSGGGASAGSSGSSASPGTRGSSSGAGNALVSTADVPVGGGIAIPEQQVIVTQPTEGEFKAFSDICTHQSCPISQVSDGSMNCTCHFSKFSIEDGSVLEGPAEEPLPEKQITVSGDSITLG